MNKGFLTPGGGVLISLIIVVIIALSSWLLVTHLSTVKEVSDSDAFSSSNTSSYTNIGELLVNTNSATGTVPFKYNTFKAMLDKIPNSGSGNNMSARVGRLKTLLNEDDTATEPNAITSADLRANNSDKSVVVRLGGLDWIVTFVSNDINGNVIVTLWLSNNHQEAWGYTGQSGLYVSDSSNTVANRNLGSYYGVCNGGLYSHWSCFFNQSSNGIYVNYPCNMYGTSYIRVETLNNPSNRKYATANSELSSEITQSEGHIFSLYTQYDKGLIQYLATPSNMKWMTNLQSPEKRGSDKWYNNEALTSDNLYGYSGSWSNTNSYCKYSNKELFDTWGGDYLWLPSVAETGISNQYSGLWETSTAERSTYDGTTATLTDAEIGSQGTQSASTHSWSRSAYAATANSVGKLAFDGGSAVLDVLLGSLAGACAVRPALLLNLTKVAETLKVANISFDRQGGSGGTDSNTIVSGDSFSNITAPTRPGYVFDGYYTQTNGAGDKIYNANGTPAVTFSTFTTNKTLYAKWTANTYYVKYNANGGSGTMSNSTHTYGTAKNLTANAFTRSGYNFVGWATSSTGAKVYNNSQSVTNLTTTHGATFNLYAVWQIASVTLTLNNQSATTSGTTSVEAVYNAALPSITVPTRTEYVFDGYYTGTNGSGNKIYNADGSPAISVSTFMSNTTIYAKWIPYSVVTIESNIAGAMGLSEGAGSYAPNSTITLSAYANKGYDFGHWLRDGATFDGNSTNKISVLLTDDVVYTAVFNLASEARTNYAVAIECENNASAVAFGGVYANTVEQNGTKYVSLTALPCTGYSFEAWKIDGTKSTTYTARNALIPLADVAGKDIVAVFVSTTSAQVASQSIIEESERVEQSATLFATGWGTSVTETSKSNALLASTHTISVSANNTSAVGVLSSGGSFSDGATVTLKAYPLKGYQFAYWLCNGSTFDGYQNNQISVTVTADFSYTAIFVRVGQKVEKTVLQAVCEGDSIGEAGRVGMSTFSNDTTTFVLANATANAGFRFVGWKIEGVLSQTYTEDTVAFASADVNNKVITAVFVRQNSSNINLDLDNSG